MTHETTTRLYDELTELHAAYATAINHALEDNDVTAAEELAKAYDDDAWELVAKREGRTHQLRQLRRPAYDTPLRRLVRWLDDYTRWAFNPQPPLDPRSGERVPAGR
ncbi:hypothetical protein [Nocardioides caldifontis]|uniref:hypothetical protein n=1 Tax=Nocardioides caldifontis TaxID=2588938 RepID=UPI0011DF4DC3|nr:hypothetical protein [Nocardioides caldifontis]